MEKTKQPGIKFDAILLKDLVFTRNVDVAKKQNIDISFSGKIGISDEKTKMSYELECIVSETNQSFSVKCTMVGLFSIDEAKKNMSLQQFAENNAPALIYPYVREIITTTTLKAHLPPVLLPPLNITALIKEKEPAAETASSKG